MKNFRFAFFCFLGCSFYIFIPVFDGIAQSNPKSVSIDSLPTDTTLLFLDPSKISPVEIGRIYTALAKLSTQYNAIIERPIKANENLNSIIKKAYNFTDDVKHHITSAIKDAITERNNLDRNYTLIKGENISIPKLPVGLSSKSSKRYTQYFDIYANRRYLSSTDSLAGFTLSKFTEPVDFDKGGLIAYKLEKNDLKQFITLISDTLYNNIYGKSIVAIDTPIFVEIDYLDGLESSVKLQDSTSLDSTVVDLLKNIDTAYFRKYYVFDYFNGKSGHGKKVLDVIASRFKKFGLDTINYKIIPVSINYFQNKDESIRFLERFYQLSKINRRNPAIQDLVGINLIKYLKSYEGDSYKDCESCIPEGFLNAIFNYYYSLKPDIISTSFSAFTKNSITPQFTETTTSLLTAGLNVSGNIESLFNREQLGGSQLNFQQPLLSYFNSYPNAGCIIVGNRVMPGKFAGWYSLNGDRMTTLGQGIGWGNDFTTIKPKESGASFATPDVAAQLYIAKAYWLSKKVKVNSIESRVRLLLATDIDSSFIGKFASGGVVNIKKLLQLSAYAEMANGNIVPITFNTGSISYNDVSKCPLKRDGLYKGKYSKGICGLTIIGSRFYAFAENDLCWKEIDINNISINITANGIPYLIRNSSDFSKTFKQIVLLNNL
jgi:hypothetical protein